MRFRRCRWKGFSRFKNRLPIVNKRTVGVIGFSKKLGFWYKVVDVYSVYVSTCGSYVAAAFVAEWSKALHLRCNGRNVRVGSNPTECNFICLMLYFSTHVYLVNFIIIFT